jgi:hypothetical protein
MKASAIKGFIGTCAVCVVCVTAPVSEASAGYVVPEARAATNAELEDMRGGFIADGGLRVSLGIVRAVFVDGILQAVSSFNLKDALGIRTTVETATKTSPLVAFSSPSPDRGASAKVQGETPPSNSSQAALAVSREPAAAAASSGVRITGEAAPAAHVTASGSSKAAADTLVPVSTDAATQVKNIGNLTLVQNSADQKVIQNFTVVNATTNSLSVIRQVNMMMNIRQQFINMTK